MQTADGGDAGSAGDGGPVGAVTIRQSLDAGIVRRYADRIDECLGGPVLTDVGRTLCEREATVWVYEADGGLHTSFVGEKLSVLGNEVWISREGSVEHRTDTPSALRFDAALMDARISGAFHGAPWGAVSPGKSVRAGMTDVVEVSWDGGTLSVTKELANIALPYAFIFFEGDTLWSDLCTVSPGCQTSLCPPIKVCPFREPIDRRFLGFDENGIWVSTTPVGGRSSVALWPRPLSASFVPPAETLSPTNASNTGFHWLFGSHDGPLLSPITSSDGFVVPRATHDGVAFLVLQEPLLTVTPHLIITLVDAQTLRLTPRP